MQSSSGQNNELDAYNSYSMTGDRAEVQCSTTDVWREGRADGGAASGLGGCQGHVQSAGCFDGLLYWPLI